MGDRPDVVVVGDVMIDVSVDAATLARGGDVHGDVRLRPGGTGTNAAAWAAQAGAATALYGRVGADPAGRILAEAVSERGVRANLAVDPDAPTGTMLVVRERGERSMVADRGANARLAPHDLPRAIDAGAVLVSGYLLFHPGSESAARAALGRARAAWVAVDAASWPLIQGLGASRFLELASGATMLLMNKREAEALTGRPPHEAARDLGERVGCAAVKMGPRGAVMAVGDRVIASESPAVVEADPTGAGDAFDGVLLALLARGAPADEALRRACQAGARAAASASSWPEP